MTPIFIDFEASSLDPNSWPIEIGLAWIEGAAVQSTSRLIRPEQTWPASAWSRASAAVHGIRRRDLDQGNPAIEVARWAVAQIGNRFPISDAPEFDQRWFDRLLDLDPLLDRPTLRDFDLEAAAAFRFPAIARVYGRRDRDPRAHRAEADARELAEAWLLGLEDGPRK